MSLAVANDHTSAFREMENARLPAKATPAKARPGMRS
jgi:hypothetical protein